MPEAIEECQRDPPVAPAHGGVGSGGAARSGSPENMVMTDGGRRGIGAGGWGGARAGGGNSSGGGADRVARLGSALDEIQTRADGTRRRGGAGGGARSGEKVCGKRVAYLAYVTYLASLGSLPLFVVLCSTQ